MEESTDSSRACAKSSNPTSEYGDRAATELTDHITDAQTKQATQEFVRDLAITPQDIAEMVAFAVSRPRRMTLNEILVRPTAQLG
ncbi:MAG: hypothetical protein WBV85_02195 [Solirubrobacteraceae bacterium]